MWWHITQAEMGGCMSCTLTEEIREEMREVDVGQIDVNPGQPRRHFSEDELEELAQSIRSVGLIHPPVVRRQITEEGREKFEIIAGERRFRAAQMAGLHRIPVCIRNVDAELSAEAALIENVQRVDLNPIEVAIALRTLIEKHGLRQDELARRIGKKRSTIANYLRLLSLPKTVQDSVWIGKITMGHAKVILSLPSDEERVKLHKIIEQEDLTVRQAESLASESTHRSKPRQTTQPKSQKDVHIRDVEERLQRHFGTKVSVQSAGKKGKIALEYYSDEDFNRLLELLGLIT